MICCVLQRAAVALLTEVKSLSHAGGMDTSQLQKLLEENVKLSFEQGRLLSESLEPSSMAGGSIACTSHEGQGESRGRIILNITPDGGNVKRSRSASAGRGTTPTADKLRNRPGSKMLTYKSAEDVYNKVLQHQFFVCIVKALQCSESCVVVRMIGAYELYSRLNGTPCATSIERRCFSAVNCELFPRCFRLVQATSGVCNES